MNFGSTDVIILSGSTAGTSLMTNMIIFNDPIFLYISVISAFVGVFTSFYDLHERKKLLLNIHAFFILFKGAFIGFLSAPLMMLILLLIGTQIAHRFGFNIQDTQLFLNSTYFIISLLFSRMITKKIMLRIDDDSK